jgi:antitoxin PrlF
MKSVVSEKGQVTIPKALRDRLGLVPGQVVDFSEDRGTLVGRKVSPVDRVEASFGIVDLNGSTDEWMASLRGDEDPE